MNVECVVFVYNEVIELSLRKGAIWHAKLVDSGITGGVGELT